MVSRKTVAGGTRGYKSIKKPFNASRAGTRKRNENFSLYIYKVLKETSGNREAKGINRKAMNIMNSMVFDIFDQITNQSSQLIRYTNKRTLTGKEIEAAVKLLFPFDLAQHAIQEGRRAVDKFQAEN